MTRTAEQLYKELLAAYGEPRWWSEDPFTVMFQAVLVQNTMWSSVEKVTGSMGSLLTPETVSGLPAEELADLIRPCGFASAKAQTVKRLTAWYGTYGFSAEALRAKEKAELRGELTAIKGIGAETADAIMVFAFHKTSFIIDAYTRRFLRRLGHAFRDDGQIRAFFEGGLPDDFMVYGRCHWLILDHGQRHCKKTPVCAGCAFGDCAFRREKPG